MIITVKEQNYNLKLSIKGVINLEQKMGTNPVNVLMNMAQNTTTMPEISQLALIMHEAFQPFNHGISLDDTYNLLGDWFEEGHSITDLVQVVVELFTASGLIPKEEEIKEETGKNVKKTSK